MSTSTSQHLSCPHCHAHVRAGSDWCTLCYGDLRPPSATPAVLDVSVTVGDERVEVPAGRGKHARSAAPPSASATSGPTSAATVDEGEIDRMLAQLAAQSGRPLGRFAGRFDTPASKVGLMVGGTVVAGLALLLLMALVGALL